jgi:hypothetical protein
MRHVIFSRTQRIQKTRCCILHTAEEQKARRLNTPNRKSLIPTLPEHRGARHASSCACDLTHTGMVMIRPSCCPSRSSCMLAPDVRVRTHLPKMQDAPMPKKKLRKNTKRTSIPKNDTTPQIHPHHPLCISDSPQKKKNHAHTHTPETPLGTTGACACMHVCLCFVCI